MKLLKQSISVTYLSITPRHMPNFISPSQAEITPIHTIQKNMDVGYDNMHGPHVFPQTFFVLITCRGGSIFCFYCILL